MMILLRVTATGLQAARKLTELDIRICKCLRTEIGREKYLFARPSAVRKTNPSRFPENTV